MNKTSTDEPGDKLEDQMWSVSNYMAFVMGNTHKPIIEGKFINGLTPHQYTTKMVEAYVEQRVLAGRIAENQRWVDLADEFNNRKPKPGELTAASFGSAGAGMIATSYYKSFKERISVLQAGLDGLGNLERSNDEEK